MLDVDNATAFLLDRGLIDLGSILDGDYVVASAARRNRNLRVQGRGGGYLLKQPGDPTEGGHATLRAEAAFYAYCLAEPRAEPMRDILPRLAYCDPQGPLLALELYADARPLWMAMSAQEAQAPPRQVPRALGRALGTFHRVFRTTDGAIDPGLGWLARSVPWVMLVHKPGPELLATISQANYQALKILQTHEDLSARLDALRKSWRVETVIHNDIKSDNVLIRPGSGPEADAVEARIVDWELVQLGDPAWDLAGALQDLLLFWVQSIPMAPELTADQMMAAARYPLAAVQSAFRALWAGYRATAGLPGEGVSALLTRAVAFSAPRLIQSAYEMSYGAPALLPAAVILLQVGSNILHDPELAQVQLYGLHGGAIL
jgi:hypothetical protein